MVCEGAGVKDQPAEALKVVLEAALTFFASPDQIPNIKELRSSGLKAALLTLRLLP
jgi:hypothetical protein